MQLIYGTDCDILRSDSARPTVPATEFTSIVH